MNFLSGVEQRETERDIVKVSLGQAWLGQVSECSQTWNFLSEGEERETEREREVSQFSLGQLRSAKVRLGQDRFGKFVSHTKNPGQHRAQQLVSTICSPNIPILV